MRPDLDPAYLSPDGRFHELVALLASGLLRLRDKTARTPGQTSATQIVSDSSDSAVAVGPETWLTVHTG